MVCGREHTFLSGAEALPFDVQMPKIAACFMLTSTCAKDTQGQLSCPLMHAGVGLGRLDGFISRPPTCTVGSKTPSGLNPQRGKDEHPLCSYCEPGTVLWVPSQTRRLRLGEATSALPSGPGHWGCHRVYQSLYLKKL